MKREALFLLGLLMWLSHGTGIQASGSYRIAIPRPTQTTERESAIDRDKYALGQLIYSGKASLVSQTAPKDQKNRLEKCQAQLPENVAKSKDLTAMSERLTEAQLAALEYYIGHRYPQK